MTTTQTFTATIARTYPVGPKQLGFAVAAGETVTLLRDPAQQDGDLISFKYGRNHGVARIADLRNIEAK